MRTALSFVALSLCSACGTSSDRSGQAPVTGGPAKTTAAVAFDPPPAAEGYTRIVSPTVHDVGPGDDVTYCQYLLPPFDHDVDVLDVAGYQSAYGHHAVAFTYSPKDGEETGTTLPCMGTEFTAGADGGTSLAGGLSMGTFLGAIGGADGRKSATSLPEGVAFRLQKGQGVMLNVHYLNTGEETIDGDAVVDVKFADAEPTRKIAALFVNLNTSFSLAPSSPTTSSVDCVAQSDVEMIMFTNHMHDYGTSATTQVKRVGSDAFEMTHEDPSWTYDMQFNPVYTRWDVAAPFVVHTGDTLRTTCNWENKTADTVPFPREMCVGVGFVLTTGANPTAPVCFNGNWVGPTP